MNLPHDGKRKKAVVQQSIVMPIWRTVAFEIEAAVLFIPKRMTR